MICSTRNLASAAAVAALSTLTSVTAFGLLAGCAATGKSAVEGQLAATAITQLSFATPEGAVAALANATATNDADYMRSIFGPEIGEFSTGDPDVDAYERQLFAAAIFRRSELRPDGTCGLDVLVGEKQVPFPAPIIAASGRWIFDTPKGVDRLADQRVGYNELRTVRALRAIRVAQVEYQSTDRDGDGTPEFAAQFMSDDGQRNGLYWPTSDTEPNSPLGSFYTQGEVPASASRGYDGYFFRNLDSQGFCGRRRRTEVSRSQRQPHRGLCNPRLRSVERRYSCHDLPDVRRRSDLRA